MNRVEREHRYLTLNEIYCEICRDVFNEEFKDNVSYHEYLISGLCQECQDKVFDQATDAYFKSIDWFD